MNTYKIGNKVKCIIRSYRAGQIGNENMEWDNQPYTILKDVGASLYFNSKSKTVYDSQTTTTLQYNFSNANNLRLSNILLTDKILNLIYPKIESKLCNTSEFCTSSSNNEIFLTIDAEEIYQVFIYNKDGFEAAYGSLNPNEPITVNEPDSSYLICYSFVSERTYSIDNFDNLYLTIDLEIDGNINDETSKMWIHLEKCALNVDKNLYFQNMSNAIDLNFTILDGDNYISFDK